MDRIKLAILWFLNTFFEKYFRLCAALVLMVLNLLPFPQTVGEAILLTIVVFIFYELIEYLIKKIKISFTTI